MNVCSRYSSTSSIFRATLILNDDVKKNCGRLIKKLFHKLSSWVIARVCNDKIFVRISCWILDQQISHLKICFYNVNKFYWLLHCRIESKRRRDDRCMNGPTFLGLAIHQFILASHIRFRYSWKYGWLSISRENLVEWNVSCYVQTFRENSSQKEIYTSNMMRSGSWQTNIRERNKKSTPEIVFSTKKLIVKLKKKIATYFFCLLYCII